MFLTNNSPDLYALTSFMHYVQQKNSLFLARLPGISANSNKNYICCNFQDFANILRNFQKISGNIKFRENYNPMCVCLSVVVCAIPFESPETTNFIFGMQVHVQNIWVKVKYQGHRVKVMVIRA